MRIRPDGSIQPTATPTYQNAGRKEDHAIYRCMITKVIYVDDPLNITTYSPNPRVLYDVVVLGGFASGQIISNCRLASDLGGNDAYWERTLRASRKKVSKSKLAEQDGDIVFVQFVQGHTGFPVITALDQGLNTTLKIGATKAQGPMSLRQFNGVWEQINKDGELILKIKGGKADSDTGAFAPSSTSLITTKFDKNEKYTRTFKSGLAITEDGKNDKFAVANKAGAKLNLTKDKIAFGSGSVELLDKFSALMTQLETLLTSMATETHIGNLGAPTGPPLNAAAYNSVKTAITDIKTSIEGIKGSL